MNRQIIPVLLMLWAGAGIAATASKAAKQPKAAKAPALEKLSCRTGPNDEQARLIVQAVKGRVMEFAFYSRLGTRVCSIDARRGDAYSKWEDGREPPGHAAIKLRSGMALVAYEPGHVVLKFSQVERMPFCGMHGELNGSIELVSKKSECNLDRIFEGSGEQQENTPVAEEKTPVE